MNNTCLICYKGRLEPLLNYYSRYNKYFFSKIAICKNCGHVQLYPVPKHREYKKTNDRFFSSNYSGIKQNVSNNEAKQKILMQRLDPFIKKSMSVLDVGAGEGWALEYVQSLGAEYYAVESVKSLANSIVNRGGMVVAKSIENLEKIDFSYDIIIFRHVIEHLINPQEMLKYIVSKLNNNGILYLALPDGSLSKINKTLLKKGFRTSFIRPIHISYFCKENVNRITNNAGLIPLVSEVENEIYGIYKKNNSTFKKNENLINNYKEIKKNYLHALNVTKKNDNIKIIKDFPRAIIKRLTTTVRNYFL